MSEILSAETLGTDKSMFVIVAIGNRGLLAAGSLLVQRPTTTPIGTCGVCVLCVCVCGVVCVCVRKSPWTKAENDKLGP